MAPVQPYISSDFELRQPNNNLVNDPAPIPDPNAKEGSIHWTFERLLSLALVPLTIAPFAAGSLHPVTDAVLGATMILHSHIGFQYDIPIFFEEERGVGC